ncbi:hypothetical protein Ddye_032326 [Dipteronia dyeriana]|uniref:DDE Tnp4 domain-containing protein n=1 Tax=Dipteronia dyeriana TaxID=168575 RepID=A0AAD9TL01_9ROSI|nr:hypothetical protein Ddye_032326 [Dipteronia dyeriana]
MEMGDSQNGNGKGKGKNDTYQQWTMDVVGVGTAIENESMTLCADDTDASNDLEDGEMNHDEMSEEEDTEIDEEFYEAIKILVMTIQSIIHVVNKLRVIEVGKYFLADCGFANRCQFLAPYRGVRYHLQDFTGNGNDPENEKEIFNLRHASFRNVIERIFAVFKYRFTIFKSTPPFPFITQVEIVLACVALYNFLRNECRSDEFPIEEEYVSSSSPIVEEEFKELVSQTQEQQREETNAWRLSIADYMWRKR